MEEQLQKMIEACDQAILDVLSGKTVTFNGRSVSRESLSQIRDARKAFQEELALMRRASRGQRHRISYVNFNPEC